MAEFLLELLSEEIPARMQVRAMEDLTALITKSFDEALVLGADYDSNEHLECYATPRRLVIAIADLRETQPDVGVSRKGPRVDAPEKAIEGFKRSLGTDKYELEERDDKKGAYFVAKYTRVGRPTAEVLAETLPEILKNFPWAKSMRWSDHDIHWVRPLQSILCLLDGVPVPFSFGPVASGNRSRGHRFHAPEPFEVESFSHYRKELARRYVVLDRDERLEGIKGQAELIAKQHGLRLRDDPGLLEEVTGLVEWPTAVCGTIDKDFMELPPEVLVTSMRTHQKYLALEDESGNLASRFVAIANLEAKDGGEAIIAGNERVLRARLWDAKFFWDQDGRRPLAELAPKLDDIVFHAKLGSVGDKVRRIEGLAAWIVEQAQLVERSPNFNEQPAQAVKDEMMADARRAAHLAKADLISGMVGEFPELQGLMGRYYAEKHGEPMTVCQAIGEHYSPQGPNDDCPTAPVSAALALADKLDTLAGFFMIGEKPTGSRDPFALRRAALGVIRLIVENEIRLPLGAAFVAARSTYSDETLRAISNVDGEDPENFLKKELIEFFGDRLKVHLRASGVRYDLISAVFATGDDDLVRVLARVDALKSFLATEQGADLLAGYRRANNIVRIESKKSDFVLDGNVDIALLKEAEETALYEGLKFTNDRIGKTLKAEDFTYWMAVLASLRSQIDEFFEKVIVNADDPKVRKNRLNLLSNIHRSIAPIADFSLIEDVVSDNDNRRVA